MIAGCRSLAYYVDLDPDMIRHEIFLDYGRWDVPLRLARE